MRKHGPLEICTDMLTRHQGADPLLGRPTALDATRIFRQERYEAMFLEQVQNLPQQAT